MSTLDKARMAIKVFSALVLSVGMAVLPGTAAAADGLDFSGTADFCDDAGGPYSYDNNDPQTTGLFTDLRRGTQINADYDACQLKLTGSVGSASDMWITLVAPHWESAPTFQCVYIEIAVVIHKFDNRKAVGLVSNYDPDPAVHTGLFVGLYDNGNTDALTISVFDGTTGKLMVPPVATYPLGSKIKENVPYNIFASVCNGGGELFAEGHVTDLMTYTPVFSFETPEGTLMPPNVSPIGQIGIAGWAKSSFVDSTVLGFRWAAALGLQ